MSFSCLLNILIQIHSFFLTVRLRWKVLSHAKGKFSASSGPQHSSQSRTIEGLPSAVEHGEGEKERECKNLHHNAAAHPAAPDCYRHLCRAFYFGRVQKSRSRSKTLGSCKNRSRKWGHAHSTAAFPIPRSSLLNYWIDSKYMNLQTDRLCFVWQQNYHVTS